MWEGAAEECAVNGTVSTALGRVDILASWAKKLDCLLEGVVAETDGQQWLLIAKNTRTSSKVGALVLFQHLGQSACGDDVSGVYQSIEQLGLCFYRVPNRVGEIIFERVSDEIEGLWVVLHFGVEACEVEAI